MSEPTDAQLAAFLNDFAKAHDKGRTPAKDVACLLRLAAQRLEGRGISEAKLQTIALAILNVSRKQWGAEPIAWDSPYLTAAHKSTYLELARVASEVAHPMFLRALDTIDSQRKEIDALVDDNKALIKDLEEVGQR